MGGCAFAVFPNIPAGPTDARGTGYIARSKLRPLLCTSSRGCRHFPDGTLYRVTPVGPATLHDPGRAAGKPCVGLRPATAVRPPALTSGFTPAELTISGRHGPARRGHSTTFRATPRSPAGNERYAAELRARSFFPRAPLAATQRSANRRRGSNAGPATPDLVGPETVHRCVGECPVNSTWPEPDNARPRWWWSIAVRAPPVAAPPPGAPDEKPSPTPEVVPVKKRSKPFALPRWRRLARSQTSLPDPPPPIVRFREMNRSSCAGP